MSMENSDEEEKCLTRMKSPLYYAVYKGLPNKVRVLLEYENNFAMNEISKYGESLLMTALRIENRRIRFKIIVMLIEADTNMYLRNRREHYLLKSLLLDGDYDDYAIAELLIEYVEELHTQSDVENTPYDITAGNGATSMIRFLGAVVIYGNLKLQRDYTNKLENVMRELIEVSKIRKWSKLNIYS